MPNLEFDFGVSAVVNSAIQIGIIILGAIALMFIGRWIIPRVIAARVPKVRRAAAEEPGARAKTISDAAVRVFSIVVWVVAVTMVLGQLGVDIGPLLAGLGVGALALGFAAQNIIRDYLNGFFILMEDWYRIGEWVGAIGVEGTVEQVTLRRTILREIDGTLHNIPNSQISFATNRMRDWGRINLTTTVAYKENLDYVYKAINEVCQELKDDPEWGGRLQDTPAVVRVGELGDHGVGIVIRGYTQAGEHWGLTGELRRRIKNRFDADHIEIPWPHTKVYFGNAPTDGAQASA
jgi:small conductance mechanosensitive channel